MEARTAADEMKWLRTRALWVPFMNVNFKKPGGYTGADLITLSFDKEEQPQTANKSLAEIGAESIERFKKAKEQLGSKIRKQNG